MPVVELNAANLESAARRLPSSPRVYGALEAALRSPDVAVDAVVNVVRVDPILAARVVRAANSPVFRRGEPLEHLDAAIGRVGLREIHRLVGAAVAEQLFAVGLPLYRISGDALWLNALVTALAAEELARAAAGEPREAYTLGLLRGAGRMVLQRVAHEEALPPASGARGGAAASAAWELTTFGVTSDEAGARLLALWSFPEAAVAGLRHAGAPAGDPRREAAPARLHVAAWMAVELGHGLAVEAGQWNLEPEVLAQAGLDLDRVQACLEPTREALARTVDMFGAPGAMPAAA